MSRVTRKLQITIPKRLAEQHRIQPGDEIEFRPEGDAIRLVPAGSRKSEALDPEERLRLFDEATARQAARQKQMKLPAHAPSGQGWRREDLYTRGKPRR